MSGEDNFIARWSRLKRSAARSKDPQAEAKAKDRLTAGSGAEPASRPPREVQAKTVKTEPSIDPASLPPIESIVAGIKIKAHPLFRIVATMNDDASTFDLPEYIHSRLQPQILIDFPERDEEHAILRENLPFGEEQILDYVTDFLQQAHAADERYTVRDGINITRYASKLMAIDESPFPRRDALRRAILETLGEEALRYAPGS